MGATAAVAGGLAVFGAAGSAIAAQKKAGSTQAELETEKLEVKSAEKERSIQRMDSLNTLIGSNLTVAASRGISPSSGSFKAITSSSFEKFNQDEKMDEFNTALKEQYIQQEEEASQEQADATGLGGFLGAASSMFSKL